jgi:hypothetical protein
MKTLITALTLATVLVTAPAFAAPRGSDAAVVNGQVIGYDPDLNIRAALMREPAVTDY